MDASKIRAYRRDTGLSQAGLAARLGVAQSTVCNWEKARSEPSRRYTMKLAVMIGQTRIQKIQMQEAQRAVQTAIARAARQNIDQRRGMLLRRLRLEHDLTLEESSGLLGYAPVIVARWETGEYTMSVLAVEEIEKLFRVSLSKAGQQNAVNQ